MYYTVQYTVHVLYSVYSTPYVLCTVWYAHMTVTCKLPLQINVMWAVQSLDCQHKAMMHTLMTLCPSQLGNTQSTELYYSPAFLLPELRARETNREVVLVTQCMIEVHIAGHTRTHSPTENIHAQDRTYVATTWGQEASAQERKPGRRARHWLMSSLAGYADCIAKKPTFHLLHLISKLFSLHVKAQATETDWYET